MVTDSHSFKIQASVSLASNLPFDKCARALSGLNGQLQFVADQGSRFDEVPAYVAKFDGGELVLLGIPDGESGDGYVLQMFTAVQRGCSHWKSALAGTFLEQLLQQAPNVKMGMWDLSDAIVKYLTLKGIQSSVNT